MRFIDSLAILQLCVLVASYDQYFSLNNYDRCDNSLYDCPVGQQCTTCYTKGADRGEGKYCNNPDSAWEASICNHVDNEISCGECGPINTGLDRITGLDYITNAHFCTVDRDCINAGVGQQCASCYFEAFESNIQKYSNFCFNKKSNDVRYQYCNSGRNKGRCVCGDDARGKLQLYPSDQAGIESTGQEQAGFAPVGFDLIGQDQTKFGFPPNSRVADNGVWSDGNYVVEGSNQPLDSSNQVYNLMLEEFPIY